MACLACGSALLAHMRYCSACGTLVPQQYTPWTGEPSRALLELELGRQYEILRVIGRGGMGVVYLGRERGLDRLVAIKVLAPSLTSTPDLQARFRREAQTAARLSHPGIVPLYSFGEADDWPYFVMAYVRGESLAERLRQEGALPAATARRILCELADALDYAHRHHVVHRDIKPENVLIEDETGRAILADFGIAKTPATGTETLTLTGVGVGTPLYMSPEQAAAGHVDGRSDIYSLGLVGYAMLAGRPPFHEFSPAEAIIRHATLEPPPLRVVAPGVPEDLASAITRCLAKNPDARWPDGRSLCTALAPEKVPEAGVPDDLRELASFGTWSVLWAAVWSWLIANDAATAGDRFIFVLNAALVPIGFALQAWNIHRKGFHLLAILQVAMWPPKWWGLWWPSPLRRPDDVWRQIPTSVRVTRAVLTAQFLAVPIATYLRWKGVAWFGLDAATTGSWLQMLEYGVVVSGAASVAAVAWMWRGNAFATDDLAKLLVGPTASTSFWTRPSIARLLQPERGSARLKATPETPHDCLLAIVQIAGELEGSARGIGSEAIAAARQLNDMVERLDQEIATLARDADPSAAAQLERRLAEIENQDEDERQLRQLLRRQLDVLARFSARVEIATANRARLKALAQELWLAVAEYRRLRPDEARDREADFRARVERIRDTAHSALRTAHQTPRDASTT